ncbi:MAG TPA: CPBP family intramembrane glutamic endopeptidase [Bacteroidia bacterium]|nr:CPBP family intramembrane glutamic endopeptidase [Bacteroidia bacterium]
MKKIWKYLQSYFKEEVKPAYFITILLMVAALVYLEYTYDMEKTYVTVHFWNTPVHFAASFIQYSIPFLGSYILYIIFYKRWDVAKNPAFWGTLVVALAIFAFRSSWFDYRHWVQKLSDPESYYYNMRCTNQIAQGMLIFTPCTLFWLFFNRKLMPLYGFKIRGVDLQPYLIMLLGMVPLVAWASFQGDFLRTYPMYGKIIPEGFTTMKSSLKIIFFELCYGFDFVMTEFFFRGFLILAFARFVGRGCIMPMVAFYVVIHFGKPLGETISSFFGGLILGVIAYETRSIIGGIIAHLGVAWMMETGGTFGRGLDLAK